MTFDVWPTRVGEQDLKSLRGKIDVAAKKAVQELKASGCRAAHYRLSGTAVGHICVAVLPRDWRMMIAFPGANEVVVLLVGQHHENSPETSVYQRLYNYLGIAMPSAERFKPACCDDGVPPVDPELVDRFIEQSKVVERDRRRQASS